MSQLNENLDRLHRKVEARIERLLIRREQAGQAIADEAFDRPAFGFSDAEEPLVISQSGAERWQWKQTAFDVDPTSPAIVAVGGSAARQMFLDFAEVSSRSDKAGPATTDGWGEPPSSPKDGQLRPLLSSPTGLPSDQSDRALAADSDLLHSGLPTPPQRGVIRRILAAFGWR